MADQQDVDIESRLPLDSYSAYGTKPTSAYERSIELQQLATAELPEGTSSNYRGESSYAPHPMVYMDHGDGANVTDIDGNEYIDLFCGVSSIITGHSPEEQVNAVQEQVGRGSYFATTHEAEYETARLLNDLLPYSDRTKFISTGTEALMSAVRVARAYSGKDKIVKFEGMYHGHFDYAFTNVHTEPSSLGTRHNPESIASSPGIPDQTLHTVDSLPWNDIDLVEEKLDREGDDIAAIITEGVMSNSGLIYPEPDFLGQLREVTREHDVLLILDEVVTGFRMGLQGAQGYYDLEPDLAVYGKALANGYPNAAVTGRAEIMDFIGTEPEKADFSGTFSGNPLVIAATKANLEMLQDIGPDGYTEFQDRGQRLVEGFREIFDDAGYRVRCPDFAGFTCLQFLDDDAEPESWSDWRDIAPNVDPEMYKRFASAMIGEGMYMVPRPFGRINLSHAHTDSDIDAALEGAKSAVNHLS